MRKHLFSFIFIICLFSTGFIYGQVKQDVDELKKQLAAASTDTDRFKILDQITTNYLWYANQTDSSSLYSKAELQLGSKINQPYYLAESYINIGWHLMNMGNIGPAIDLFIKAIHLAQEYHFPTILIKAYHALSITYIFTGGNLELVMDYAKKAESLLNYDNDPLQHYGSLVYGPMAYYYIHTGKIDSALKYANKANEEALKYSEPFSRAAAMEVLAEVYDTRKDYSLSAAFFEKAIIAIDTLGGLMLSNIVIRYAQSLESQQKFKESLKYAHQGLSIATKGNNLIMAGIASNVLYDSYSALGNKDSALYYLQKHAALSDSILNDAKRRQILNVTFTEQIRNIELEARMAQELIQRKHNIQYAAIAIGLISFIILYLLVSQSIINARLVKYLGILGLLVSFEFVNLLLHPLVSSFTKDDPLFMLLILVSIGALLIPLHHRIEKWVTHKLVEKNKRLKEEKMKKLVDAYQLKTRATNN